MIGMAILLLASGNVDPAAAGPYNLILRWGGGPPIAIHYQDKERCELAALQVWSENHLAIDDDTGKEIKPDPEVSGANSPYAFCIPG